MAPVLSEFEISHGLTASLVAAAISTLGLITMAAIGDWGRRNSAYFSAFAVGMLMVAVLFHLIPEAIAQSPGSWRWVLAGFFGLTLVAVVLTALSRPRSDGPDLALGYASIIAVGSHSFMDGFIYELTFRKYGVFDDSLFTGIVTTAGLMLHEYPEGVIAYFLLREAGMNAWRAGVWAFIVASLTTIAGAVGGKFLFDQVPVLEPSMMLALTAGGLIYLVLFHLGPHACLTPHRRGYVVAAAGVVLGLSAIIVHDIAVGH